MLSRCLLTKFLHRSLLTRKFIKGPLLVGQTGRLSAKMAAHRKTCQSFLNKQFSFQVGHIFFSNPFFFAFIVRWSGNTVRYVTHPEDEFQLPPVLLPLPLSGAPESDGQEPPGGGSGRQRQGHLQQQRPLPPGGGGGRGEKKLLPDQTYSRVIGAVLVPEIIF